MAFFQRGIMRLECYTAPQSFSGRVVFRLPHASFSFFAISSTTTSWRYPSPQPPRSTRESSTRNLVLWKPMLARSSASPHTHLQYFPHRLDNETKTREDSRNPGQVKLPSSMSSTSNLNAHSSNSKSLITSMTVYASTDGDSVSPTMKAGCLGTGRIAVRLSVPSY